MPAKLFSNDVSKLTVTYFQDLVENTVTGENVGTGDGSTTTFYLDNTPVVYGSVKVYVDGEETTDVTVNHNTGEIEFGTAPASGAAITADYEYYTYNNITASNLVVLTGYARLSYTAATSLQASVTLPFTPSKVYYIGITKEGTNPPTTGWTAYQRCVPKARILGNTLYLYLMDGSSGFNADDFAFVWWIVICKR